MSSRCPDGQEQSDGTNPKRKFLSETEEAWLHAQWRKHYPSEVMGELGRMHSQMANLIKQSGNRWDGKVIVDGKEVCALHEHKRLETALKEMREDLGRFSRFMYETERDATGMEGEKRERSVGATTRRGHRSQSADLPKLFGALDSVGTMGTPIEEYHSPSDLPKLSGPESVNIFSTRSGDSPPDLPGILNQAWISFDQALHAETSDRKAADDESIRPNTPAEQPGSSIWDVLSGLSGIFQARPS
jgi:hypothetical protein